MSANAQTQVKKRPAPMNRDAVKKPPAKPPTEEEVVSAESVLACVGVDRHNFLDKSQAVQNHFGQVMKSGNKEDALAVMQASDVLRRFAEPKEKPQAQTLPNVPTSKPTQAKDNHITQSGCWLINENFKIGERGVSCVGVGGTPTSNSSPTREPSENPEDSSPLTRQSSAAAPNPRTMKLEELESIRMLGVGAQGKVWLKRWKTTGGLYAVKEMTISREMDPKQQALVTQELKSLIQAPSDFIVPLYQAFLKNTMLSIVQQFMDLGSLEDIMKKKPKLPEFAVASITLQLFSALYEMSTVRKQLHRDIKPANILLSRQGEVKLADFGVASNIKTIGESSFIGTTTYMSPERIKGQRYSIPSDVWAVGLIAVECVLGHYPFPYTNFMDLLDKVTSTASVTLPPETPTDMAEVLQGCLMQVPEERISCEKALSSSWLLRHKETCTRQFADWIAQNITPEEEGKS